MKRIFKYYLDYGWWILLALAFLTGEALCELQLPDYMAKMISEGIAVSNMSVVWTKGAMMLLFSVLGTGCSVVVGYLASRIGAGIARDMRKDVFANVMDFSGREYNKFSVSSLITRSTNDITQIQIFTTMFIRMVMYAPIMGVGGTIKAYNSARGMGALAWIIVAAIVVVVVMIIVLLTVVQPKFVKMQKQVDRVNQVANDELSGMMVIRAFDNNDVEQKRFEEANKDLTKTSLFTNRVMALLMPVITIVMNGMSIAVVWVASYLAQDITNVASMMAFIQYAIQIVMSFMMISMIFVLLPRAKVSAERVGEVLDTHTSIKNTQGNETPTHSRFAGEIEFDDVSFGYGGDTPAVSGISFRAEPGQTTAIIGSTGSGKSTIINLIPRINDVTGGCIKIDGVDIRDYNLEDLRANIGFVPQKNVLFSGTIASNIGYGVDGATAEEMAESAEIAQASEIIAERDEGFEGEISQGGSNVSGGQKQRLAIARAICKRAPINIFDDSFSALDFKTDAKLRGALKDKLANSTMIIVAQRVGTIRGADQIIVLDDGKIVGKGTHEELLKTCKVYLDIAKSQLSEEELGL